MLIRREFIDEKTKKKIDFENMNIDKVARKIMIFVDKTEFEMGLCKTGKAIQINMCASKSVRNDNTKRLFVDTRNNTEVDCSVYTYNAIFTQGVFNPESIALVLNNAYSICEVTDFDNMLTSRSDLGEYNRLLSTTDDGIQLEAMDGANMFMNRADVVPPIYYNSTHMLREENDSYSIIWVSTSISYNLSELIDEFTIVEIYDLKTWDTMIPFLVRDIQDKSTNKNDRNSINMINNLYNITTETIMSGYMFIYDSQMGYNVKSIPGITNVPMASYRSKGNLIRDLTMIKDSFISECKSLESEKGDIRVYYSPLLSGDKLQVHFKEYDSDNQPDFNKSKIDKDFTITESVTNTVNEFYDICESDYSVALLS